ncbi:MAG: hypothetical protein R3E86_13970 [Pseudomonadales bacterium]
MIPHPGKALADLAVKLASSIAPETNSSFAMANTGLISMLMLALSQDSERAVANRMTDLSALHALFAEAAARYPDAPQTGARLSFCKRSPASLLLSDVDAVHADGFSLLIDLHAWAEQHAAELNAQIWDFLLAHTERNRYELPGV